MDKRNLLDRVGVSDQDRILMANILDRAEKAKKRNIPAASDFLSPRQKILASDLLRLSGLRETDCVWTGGYENAERCLAYFPPDWMEAQDIEPPIRCLRVFYRPEDNLTHRDLLGGLMGIGIVREKTGDILIHPDSADVLLLDSVTDFVSQNWESAGRVKLHIQEISLHEIQPPEINFQEYHDTVPSLRLDALIASGFRVARGKAADYINAGRVQVNWRECAKPDQILTQGDIITARGLGRIELQAVNGLTRKGRVSVTIRRYP